MFSFIQISKLSYACPYLCLKLKHTQSTIVHPKKPNAASNPAELIMR